MIHYGEIIKKACKKAKYLQKQIAADLGKKEGSVHDMFKRAHQSTEILLFFEEKLGLKLLVKEKDINSEPIVKIELTISGEENLSEEKLKKFKQLTDIMKELNG